MTEQMDSERYVIYRVIAEFKEDKDHEGALARADRVTGDCGFMVSWFRRENVLEALVMQRVADLREKTLDDAYRRVREAFSLKRSVQGYVERYRFDKSTSVSDLLVSKYETLGVLSGKNSEG